MREVAGVHFFVDVGEVGLLYLWAIAGNRTLCGCSSMAELQPSKLATRVRFPSPAPKTFSAGVVKWQTQQTQNLPPLKREGSSPSPGTIFLPQSWALIGRLTQLVRVPDLHSGCRRFESVTAHHSFCCLLCLRVLPVRGVWGFVCRETSQGYCDLLVDFRETVQ